MKLSEFIEGLNILRHYYDNGDGYHLGAEHDQIYLYSTDKPVSSSDVDKLRALGWFQPDVEKDAGYDPLEGWSTYV